MDTLTLGIIGLGSIGLRHAGNALALGCRVIGFDPDAVRRSALQDIGGQPVTARCEIFDGSDAVVICSPNAMHRDDMMSAIAAGRHVMVEKPLAHKTDGLDELLATAAGNGLVVFAALNLRFNPAVALARSLLRQGSLGRPLWARFLASSYLPSWRPQQDYRQNYAANPVSGGVLFDLVHEFDLANFLLGPAETAFATARTTGELELNSEDCADVILRHDGGVVSNLHLDYVTRPPRRTIDVACSQGLLKIDVRNRSITLWDVDDRVVREEAWSQGAAEEYRDEMKQFIDCVNGDGEPLCGGTEALQVLRQVIAARALSGRPSE